MGCSVHLTCMRLCGMGAWKLIGAIYAMKWKLVRANYGKFEIPCNNAKRISRVEKSLKTSISKNIGSVSCQIDMLYLWMDIHDEDAGVEKEPPRPRREKTRVAVVGSSMVRGLEHMMSDLNIWYLLLHEPQCQADHIECLIRQLTRASNEVTVLQIRSNNMLDGPALTLIDRFDGLLDDVTHLRPLAQVSVASLHLRINSLSYHDKDSKGTNQFNKKGGYHYTDVIMGAMASQITSLTIVYPIVYSDLDQRKHESSASLAFVRGIHRRPVNSPHKWPVTRKTLPFDDVIMTFSFLHPL